MSSYYEKFLDGKVVCIDEEIPFEVPKGWEWTRTVNVFDVWSARRVHEKDWRSSGIPFYRAREIGKLADYGYVNNDLFIDETLYNEFSKSGLPYKNDLMVTAVGTIGKVYVVPDDKPFYYKDGSVLCFNNFGDLDSAFIKAVIESPMFVSQYGMESQGTTVATLTIIRVNQYLIPIPPISEQHRIVSYLRSVADAVEKYDKSQNSLNKLNAGIRSRLKASILQEAIQGKLMAQDPNDEPAEKLLEKISAEKQRLVKEGKLKAKDAITSVIFKGDDNKYYEKTGKDIVDITEEMPFDIPDSWSWCRLGTLFQHNTGKALNQADQKGKLLTYITTSNLYWDRFELDNLRKMYFTDDEIIKCTVQKGDLLVCEGGDIGRAAIWPFEEPVRIQNHIHRLRSYLPIATRFFYYTIAHYKDSGVIGGKGIGIQGLSSGVLHRLLLPVPPLAEQHRVVEKLDETLASIMSR